MKNVSQKTGVSIIVLASLILLLPGCVAKKKYIEMESYRTKAEQRVKELTLNVAELQNEFNGYKNDFHYSNSAKDLYIDSLTSVITGLNSDLSSKDANIEDQVFSFQVEKRRLNQLLAEKDREIRMAQRNTDVISVQLNDAKQEIDNLNIKLKNAESTGNAAQQKSQLQADEVEKMKVEIQKRSEEIRKLQSDLKSKNDQIEALQNQVKLLKSQFGQ